MAGREDYEGSGDAGDSSPDPVMTVRQQDRPRVKEFFDKHGAALREEAMKLKDFGRAAGDAVSVSTGAPHLPMLALYSDLEHIGRPGDENFLNLSVLRASLGVIENLAVFYGAPANTEDFSVQALREARTEHPADPVGDRRSMIRLQNMYNELLELSMGLGLRVHQPPGRDPETGGRAF